MKYISIKFKEENLVLLFFAMLFSINSYSQTIHTTTDLEYAGVASADVQSITTGQFDFLSSAYAKPLAINRYSKAQMNAQLMINSQIGDAIVTYLPVSDSSEWTSIDKEDITPLTWKWVDMQQIHADGDTSFISLRRPVRWLQQIDATAIGNTVHIELPEMGIVGLATITSIRPNQLDSRLLKGEEEKNGYAKQPITGKFKHVSTDVYNLYFKNHSKPVGVTGNHRFWSVSRNTWVAASYLDIGEKVKSTQGCQVLVQREKIESTTVYNLEIYRTHNYIVSKNELLVHNECWDKMWSFLYDQVQTNLARDNQLREMMGMPPSTSLMRKGMIANWDLKGPVRRVIYTGNHIDEDPFEMAAEWFTSLRKGAWEDGKRSIVIKFEITEAERLFPEFSGWLSDAAVKEGFSYLGTEAVKNHNGRDMKFMIFKQDKFSVVK